MEEMKKNNRKRVTIIMSALNEESNIAAAIHNTLRAFEFFEIDGEIIVVNDGSSDTTQSLVEEIILSAGEKIRLINHDKPHGVGASFWEGVALAKGDFVCMIPGDNENDPLEALRYADLLNHVDIVVPFVYNRWVRSTFRNTLSLIYRIIINTTFKVNFNYTNGTVLYRRSILGGMKHKSKSFFFQTDILIRTVKKGYLFAEVPYRLDRRDSGASKAVSFPGFLKIATGYLRLVRDIYFLPQNGGSKNAFSDGSVSAERYKSAKREYEKLR